MSDAKRHHYVPEFLMRNFTNNTGGLWTFDSRNPSKGVWPGVCENLLLEGHLYSRVSRDGTKDVTLEDKFAQLEGLAAPIIDKVIRATRIRRLPYLSAVERSTWDTFFIQQWRRVPDVFASLLTPEKHATEIERLLDEIHQSGRPVSNSERSHFLDPRNLKRQRQNLRVSTLELTSDTVHDAISSRGIAIARISNPKKSYILGSRPVVKLTPDGVTDIRDIRVEMWLPVAPDVMIGLGHTDRDEIIVDCTETQVRHFNIALANQSSVVVGRSAELIRSLSKHVAEKLKFDVVWD